MAACKKELTSKTQFMSSLDESLQRFAQAELGETDLAKKKHLEAVRKWLEENSRILSIRYDDIFLLRFLRARNFQMRRVEDCLERYVLLRQTYDNSVFREFDIRNKNIAELIDNGCVFPLLERDELGRRVLFIRIGAFDANKFNKVDVLKLGGLAGETLLESEEVQVKGLVYIVDVSGITMSHVTLFSPREMERLVKNGERIIPLRHEEVHNVNVNVFIKFAVDFLLSHLSQELKKRIFFHTNLNNIKTISTEALPMEYGGLVPMRQMIDKWKEEIMSVQSRVLLNDKIRVNEKMYSQKAREGSISALNTPLDNDEPSEKIVKVVNESFSKLEID